MRKMRLPVSLNDTTCIITDTVSRTNTPPMMNRTISWRTITADGAERGADRQRPDVAHEHFGRVGVEPEKPEARPGQRGTEDQQFAHAMDVGNLQIAGEPDVAVA